MKPSFDQEVITLQGVLADQFKPPVSLRDFRLYLTYQHSVENLDLFEWYQGYKKRFEELDYSTKFLSPSPQKKYHLFNIGSTTINIRPNASDSPPKYPHENIELEFVPESIRSNRVPPKYQPFRDEVDRILATYIISGSPHEINLSSGARHYILEQTKLTTHPLALYPAVVEILEMMRHGSFVDFRRLAVESNLDKIGWFKAVFWFWLYLPLGIVVALVPMLLRRSRWWRLCAFPLLWLGVINVLCYYSRLCVFTVSCSRRQLLPYEIYAFASQDRPLPRKVPVDEKAVLATQWRLWSRWLWYTGGWTLVFNLLLCAFPEDIFSYVNSMAY